jgi:5-methylcytosine-specific restriction endonuclease McrA
MGRDKPKKFHIDRDWFERRYLVELIPTPHLAREIGCCNEHVNFLARRFGIPIRPRQPKTIKTDRLRLDMVEVKRLYIDELMPCEAIAIIMGCQASSINRRLKAAGVKLRHHNDTKRGRPAKTRINIDPDLVAKLYAEKYASGQTVAEKFGVSRQVIDRILKESGIPKKPIGEARDYWGPKSPNWNSDLSDEERESRRDIAAQKRWREQIYKRDEYTCQKCRDDSGGNLNAHHIIPHCADKEMAWSLENGVTLCSPCHRAFHSAYGLKKCGAKDLREFLN